MGDASTDTAQGDSPQETPTLLQNQTPDFILNAANAGLLFIQSYGWFILIGALLIAYLYDRYKSSYADWIHQRQERKDDAERKKNPDHVLATQVAMETARARLQEQVRIDSERQRIEREKREEEARQEKIEEWEKHQRGGGYHSKSKSTNMGKQEIQDAESSQNSKLKPKKKERIRNSDYNPLTGQSTTNSDADGPRSYRPSARGGAAGGG